MKSSTTLKSLLIALCAISVTLFVVSLTWFSADQRLRHEVVTIPLAVEGAGSVPEPDSDDVVLVPGGGEGAELDEEGEENRDPEEKAAEEEDFEEEGASPEPPDKPKSKSKKRPAQAQKEQIERVEKQLDKLDHGLEDTLDKIEEYNRRKKAK